MTSQKPCLWKGATAGLVAGLVASWAMNGFQAALSQVTHSMPSQDEPATVKAARTISQDLLGRPLRENEKDTAGELVHYGFGTLNGILYGTLAENAHAVRAGHGLLFGATLWAVADEGLVPALGWAKGPAAYPVSSHASALVSHLVYGVTAETVRQLLR